jgi:cytochrome P450
MATERTTRPVIDFDLNAATSRAASDAAWAAVRATGCPVAWTEHNGGHWVITGYEQVAAAFRDWEHFSSARLFDPDRCAISFSNGTVPLLLPEESDPPEWKDHRRTIAALLSPLASEHLRGRARYWADHYLDRVIEQGACGLVEGYTVPVPASVVLEWMGFPRSEWEWFWTAFHGVSAHPNGTPEHRKATEAYADVMTRIIEELRDRVRAPRDDALTTIALHEVNGERISEDVAKSIAFLTVTGGIDTTTSFTGAALLHLAEHPTDRQRLLEDPDLLPLATEEFLRYYPPARTHARTVAVDTVFEGVEMKRGERVLLSEAAAGRDESAFERADEFVIDRDPNRHLAFGVGIHRCPGSHLARVEFTEMLTTVLRRIPDYAIDPAGVEEYPTWSMVGGWRRLPATFPPGPRVGTP